MTFLSKDVKNNNPKVTITHRPKHNDKKDQNCVKIVLLE